MKANGRIGLILPEINSTLDHDFIEGAYTQAKTLGYDLIVYTGIFNSMRELRFDSYISGLENIYTLICMHKLNGIIFAEERFHTQDVIEKITNVLSQTDTPCLILGGTTTKTNTINANEYESMYKITKHMTDEHHCQKIYCLAGVPNHFSSEKRLQGFVDACKDAKLNVSEDNIFYGYYWKDVPTQLGKDIAEGTIATPDAIVCCNDVMAVSVINSLIQNGVKVPEEVKVTGYDGELDSLFCQPTVTTIIGRDKQFGADAVCQLYTKISGKPCKQEQFTQSIRYGKSCGCCRELQIDTNLFEMVQQYRDRRNFIGTDFVGKMAEAETIQELSEYIDKVGHIFSGLEWLDICLCHDWQGDMENPNNFRQYGYPDKMYLLLSKRFGENEKCDYNFPTSDILPALNQPHEPHIIILTSLHCSGQILGYTASAYTDCHKISADEYYISWCDSVSCSIQSLQKKLYKQHFQQQIETISDKDPHTGIFNKRGFTFHAIERIEKHQQKQLNSYLLLITYFPEKVDEFNPETAISTMLSEICMDRLIGKLGDSLFAIIEPAQDEHTAMDSAQKIVAEIESGFIEHFGSNKLPEFVVDISTVNTPELSVIEKTISESIHTISDKMEVLNNYYNDYKENIFRLRRRIQSEPQYEWNVDEMAHTIGISRSHLQRLYRQLFSVSIKNDVINFRIQRAKQLLLHTNIRVQEVAEMCGYNNDHHFMRQFKEKVGLTPAQFRKNTDCYKNAS